MNKYWSLILILFLFAESCKKEKRYVYETQQQELYQNANDKRNLKTTTQFITIAYNDLFNDNITTTELNKLDIALQAVGDKGVVQDLIVKNFINRPGVVITDNTAMRSDIPAFVNDAYLRLYNRKPTEVEAWKMKSLIENNTDISPKMVYYSMMTAEEYRFY
ncbi:MAG: hypothetical protein U0V74_01025 [Chitinophagales bacterium]